MPENVPDRDRDARRNWAEAVQRGEPTGWFEPLYAAARRGDAVVPWDREVPNPLLVEWLANHPLEAAGQRAIVIGCGYGNDAELIAARGFETTAFDVSATAVELARQRYPDSEVDYRQADLLSLPEEWRQQFDLVIECITVQALPPDLHETAAAAVASLCGVGGLIVVISGARVGDQVPDGPPWPLTGDELGYFAVDGVERAVVETIPVKEAGPPGDSRIRWRAEFRRPDPVHDKDRTDTHWL
ncbi:class I SAM-dependent methyltransferase [Microlunatus elymi]|uniref:Class I SAM-dependent methyltransferase n=1 Tax=Microlunatus elymi TaxID=2596828 RepID=A0A516PXG2_9ACTN|nr:class I SAM-dependent methyltransferase [Microlunatus elymi]QDP95856.1 class I SAM-dependent methyltransferase [Microlunatus elymi]